MRMRLLAVTVVVVAAFAASPAAAGAVTILEIPGYDEPRTPDRYDRVRVLRFGPQAARRVLVLVPGEIGGAGGFKILAEALVRRVPGLQVWALDRRSNALEDTSRFQGATSLDTALDYYGGVKLRQVDGARDAPYARRWGLKVAVEDLRRVVQIARRGGRKVTLGGHSLGASTAVAYAAWDFAGRPGHRDIDGLVLIDGGLLGTFHTADLAEAQRRKAEIDGGDPFLAYLEGYPPWAAGVLAELGAMFAAREPQARSRLQDFPLLPPAFKPAVPVTNQGLLGYAFDRETSPAGFEGLRVDGGALAGSGDVRGWVDGGRTPVGNVARILFQEPVNSVEWYFPRRLTLDVDAASPLARTGAGRLLGLRTWHVRSITDSIYAYQTGYTQGRVVPAAHELFRRTRSRFFSRLDDPGAEHEDPLWATPSRNAFVRGVVPFLKRLG